MTYRPMKFDMREATAEEIAAHYGIRDKVSFRHFVVEMARKNGESGVAHKQYGRSTLRVFDGKAFVHHHGDLHEVTAQIGTIGGERESLYDLRIKSDYLPPLFK